MLRYLATEAACLAEEARELREELRLLRAERSPVDDRATYRQKLQAFTELVANHTIAFKWTCQPRVATDARHDLLTAFRVRNVYSASRTSLLRSALQRRRRGLSQLQADEKASWRRRRGRRSPSLNDSPAHPGERTQSTLTSQRLEFGVLCKGMAYVGAACGHDTPPNRRRLREFNRASPAILQ